MTRHIYSLIAIFSLVLTTNGLTADAASSTANRPSRVFYSFIWRELARLQMEAEPEGRLFCLEQLLLPGEDRRTSVPDWEPVDASSLEPTLKAHGLTSVREGHAVVFHTPDARTDPRNPLNLKVKDFAYRGEAGGLFMAEQFRQLSIRVDVIWGFGPENDEDESYIELTVPGEATIRQVLLQMATQNGIVWTATSRRFAADGEQGYAIVEISYRKVSPRKAPSSTER